jgi:hypothetical protein
MRTDEVWTSPMKGISRCALPIVLTLTAGPPAAFAQTLVCHAVQRGDTAARLAQRITGDARNKYQPWFHIVDAAKRSVPKSQYDRLRPGWRACIVKEPVESRTEPAPRVEAAVSSQPVTVDVLRTMPPFDRTVPRIDPTMPRVDLTMVWLGAAVLVPWLGWRVLDDYFARRRVVLIVMRHFAERFVREFERPLIQQHSTERPVRARLRAKPHRARFEILLAPGQGRRYPNLSDHKKNVEYDVVRVLDTLADESFVSGPISARAEWVVVPFQFKVGPKQPGVTCISSF